MPVPSGRYTKLLKLRNFLKNEIHRVLNRIVQIYQPKIIVCERLNFFSPQLSRRINRLLSIFGKSIVRKKLTIIGELFGISIQEVHCAYTSKTCQVCGYPDPKNRNARSLFTCRYCHRKEHADVNAAGNILARSSSELANLYLAKEQVSLHLVQQFLQLHPNAPSNVPHLLASNPYFNGRI